MRAIPTSSESHTAFLFPQSAPSSCSNSISIITHSSLLVPLHPFHFKAHCSLCTPPSPKPSRSFKFRPFLYRASKPDPTTLDDDDYSGNLLVAEDDGVDEESESLAEDGVYIEMTKLEKNSRRIQSRISIDASLDAVWSILTDYERLADFIPGLAVSQLLQKGDKFARLLQVGSSLSLTSLLLWSKWGSQNLSFLWI